MRKTETCEISQGSAGIGPCAAERAGPPRFSFRYAARPGAGAGHRDGHRGPDEPRRRASAGADRSASPRYSRFLHGAVPKFVVFLEEVEHRARSWTRDVALWHPAALRDACVVPAAPAAARPGGSAGPGRTRPPRRDGRDPPPPPEREAYPMPDSLGCQPIHPEQVYRIEREVSRRTAGRCSCTMFPNGRSRHKDGCNRSCRPAA
ncbi:hypothetical protein MAA8898_03792 [Maliponia aquimaris]|uniref:Uncharacterized protein n=1 Tax=Maliponia aquimaris TaxID=1673631 RepID=A0A238KYY3_9RHOB|nr:hypothetical protein MAA8898_03792 [Maliponia aquimaris]